MKNLFGLFARLYDFFSGRRAMLYSGTLLVVVLSIAGFRTINMAENIAAMLPDDTSATAEDFRLLQQAPFARKIIVLFNKSNRLIPYIVKREMSDIFIIEPV